MGGIRILYTYIMNWCYTSKYVKKSLNTVISIYTKAVQFTREASSTGTPVICSHRPALALMFNSKPDSTAVLIVSRYCRLYCIQNRILHFRRQLIIAYVVGYLFLTVDSYNFLVERRNFVAPVYFVFVHSVMSFYLRVRATHVRTHDF
jgi:hypothetical protein